MSSQLQVLWGDALMRVEEGLSVSPHERAAQNRAEASSAPSENVQSHVQVLWGDALLRVEEGLNAGRRWLWDEASRKVGTLIAAPSAFQGEHFLQVPPSPGHAAQTCCCTLTGSGNDPTGLHLWIMIVYYSRGATCNWEATHRSLIDSRPKPILSLPMFGPPNRHKGRSSVPSTCTTCPAYRIKLLH